MEGYGGCGGGECNAAAAVHCGGYSCWPLQRSEMSSESSVSLAHRCSGPPPHQPQCLATQYPEVHTSTHHHTYYTLGRLHKSPGVTTNGSGLYVRIYVGVIQCQCELSKSPRATSNRSALYVHVLQHELTNSPGATTNVWCVDVVRMTPCVHVVYLALSWL